MAASEGQGRPPNILLVITDQQRQPRHWPEDPGWLGELMPNEAELARTGLSFTNAFCNTAMCSPSRATLFTGRYPAEHGVDPDADRRRPAPRSAQRAGRRGDDGRDPARAARRRASASYPVARGALRLGPHSGNEPVLPPGMPNLATLLREAGLRGRLQGQVAPHPPLRGRRPPRRLGPARRERSPRLRLRRLGGARRGREREGGELRRRQRGGGGGLGRGLHAPGRALARPRRPARAVLPGRLPGQPPRVLGYPASYLRGGYAPTSSAGSASSSRRPWTRTSGQARRPGPDADGDERLPGPASRPRAPSSTTSTSTPTCTASWIASWAASSPRSATPTTRARCAREPSSCGAPTTARWGSPTAACARRCSTPTRRRSTSRSSSPTRSCSPTPRETDALASLVDVLPTLLALGGARGRTATCAAAT